MSENLETLLEVTGEKDQSKREKDQEFLKRILEAVHNLPDSQWKALPVDLKNWFNDGSDAFNDDQPIPMIPGMDEEEEEEEDEEKPRGRGRGRGGKKAASTGRGRGRGAKKDEEEEEEEDEDGEEEKEDEEEKPRGRGRSRGRGRGKAAAKKSEAAPAGKEIEDAEATEDGESVTLVVKDGRSKKMMCGEVVDLTPRALVVLDFVSEQEERIPLAKIAAIHEFADEDLEALQGGGEEEKEDEEEKPRGRGRSRGRGRGKAASGRGRGRSRGRGAKKDEEEEEEEDEEKPRGRGRGRGGKKAASTGRGRGRGKKSDGPDVPVSRRIRQIMAANPKTTQKKMEATLTKEGYDAKINTIRLTMSGFTEVYDALLAEERIVED